MVKEPGPSSSFAASAFPPTPREALDTAVATIHDQLLTGIRVLVVRKGLAETGPEITEVAEEILQSVVETALQKAVAYDPTRQAYSWLMGFAVKKIQEYLRKQTYEGAHSVIIEDEGSPGSGHPGNGAEEEGVRLAEDRIDAILYHSGRREDMTDPGPGLDKLLSLVDESDRKILTLAYVDELEGEELATAYGIRAGAAYMRLARAKEHLRQRYLTAYGIVRKDNLS